MFKLQLTWDVCTYISIKAYLYSGKNALVIPTLTYTCTRLLPYHVYYLQKVCQPAITQSTALYSQHGHVLGYPDGELDAACLFQDVTGREQDATDLSYSRESQNMQCISPRMALRLGYYKTGTLRVDNRLLAFVLYTHTMYIHTSIKTAYQGFAFKFYSWDKPESLCLIRILTCCPQNKGELFFASQRGKANLFKTIGKIFQINRGWLPKTQIYVKYMQAGHMDLYCYCTCTSWPAVRHVVLYCTRTHVQSTWLQVCQPLLSLLLWTYMYHKMHLSTQWIQLTLITICWKRHVYTSPWLNGNRTHSPVS